ncbi:Alpha-type protein kinase domain-containing protein [Mycena chlorophos]|uniref:Alpha-type protein kinase domain-containing protein n=1 Tax=Mycena chlorophos TaxID=658473 RepID=A0A8H6SU69_MYCCL|nr:Alpha-type protein kinase domain-containing protein [Mycena chlorophos]
MSQRLKIAAPDAKAGTALHTAALIYHEGGSGGHTEERIRLGIQTRLSDSKTPNTKIGNLMKYFAADTPMPDILQSCIDVISPQFVGHKLGSLPLQMTEVDLRWAQNRLPERDSMTGSLAAFYVAHSSSAEKVATYINNIPATFKSLARGHNTKLLCLELVINMDIYQERERHQAAARGAEMDSHVGFIRGALLLTLGRRTNACESHWLRPRSRITFEHFDVIVDPISYEAELLKSPDGLVEALIWDAQLAKGASKLVYDMVVFGLDGKEEQMVASASIAIPTPRAPLAGEMMFEDFIEYAKGKDVAIFSNIKFATAYLATEMPVQVTRSPSVASGLEVFDPLLEAGMTWLIEPKRAAAVSLTVHAFAHYAFGESESTLVFADLQGTPAPLQRGANDARSEDLRRVTRRVATYLNSDAGRRATRKFDFTPNTVEKRVGEDGVEREVEVLGQAVILNPETRSGRGFAHDITGALLCSTKYEWEEASVRKQLRENKLSVAPNFYIRALYVDYSGDPRKIEKGFLRSKLLVKVWVAIFLANVDTDTDKITKAKASASKRKPVADLLRFNDRVPPRTIAYAAVMLYYALSDCGQWNDTLNGVEMADMYNFLVDFFEDTVEGSRAAKRIEKLLAWWDEKVFGSGGAAGKAHDTAMASADDLWAQRAAMEEEESDDDDE